MKRVPRFHDCSMVRCRNPIDRSLRASGCHVCHRYLCCDHMRTHSCPGFPIADIETYDALCSAEFARLRAQINDGALCKYASSLNGGRKCRVEYASALDDTLAGTSNYHAHIHFDDDNNSSPPWLVRVPRVGAAGLRRYPEPMVDYIMESEYATLKFLETTAVPAPRAFGYGLKSAGNDHGVGVSFLLMEKLPGKPWAGGAQTDEEATNSGLPSSGKIWKGLADILAELAKYPFPKAGSLRLAQGKDGDDDISIEAGPIASDRVGVLDPFGPFERAIEYYTAWAEQFMELIADGQIYRGYALDAYLMHRFMKENAWQLVQDQDVEGLPEQFYLKHIDDIGHHILVDDNNNITGIIDWQLARTVPAPEAFGPSLVTGNPEETRSGPVGLTDRDRALAEALRARGSPQLARWMSDEKARRFVWGLGLEQPGPHALSTAQCLLGVFGVQEDYLTEWREPALRKRLVDDKRMRRLARVERARRAKSRRPSGYNLREQPRRKRVDGADIGAKVSYTG